VHSYTRIVEKGGDQVPGLARTLHSYEVLQGSPDLAEWLRKKCSSASSGANFVFDDGMSRDGIKVEIGFKERYFRKPRMILIIQCESYQTDPDWLVNPLVNEIKSNVPGLMLGKRGYERPDL
jgi:hypothetical protein